MLEWPRQQTILFLGSNDINRETNPTDVTEHMKSITRKTESRCSSEVVIVQIKQEIQKNRGQGEKIKEHMTKKAGLSTEPYKGNSSTHS